MKKRIFLTIILAIGLVLSACDWNPLGIPSSFDIAVETTNELGPDTLSRIDAVNETLATGMEVGPETREVIRDLNETIQQGVKAGFDEETLSRVDDLLRVAEDGLKIGLDSETLAEIDHMLDVIDEQPGQWETTASNLIRTLEGSAGSVAGRMADEVSVVIREARLNMQQLTASAGAEFRCNVDFLGSKAGSSVQEFIGRSIIGKLKSILSGGNAPETVPIPWVCQIIPDRVELIPSGERLIALGGILTITGYNYVDANAPSAYLVDESGQHMPGIELFPYRTSPYQIQINLQELDFSIIPPRSRIVFTWPNVPETSGIAIMFPSTGAPVANFQANPPSGQAPLTVQFTDLSAGGPTEWQWNFGDGATSLEQNPSHTYNDGNAYEVSLSVSNPLGTSRVVQILNITAQLTANFRFTPRQGEAPLIVQFEDQSTGSPLSWQWDFGDGQTSTERNPQHIYLDPRPEGYSVTLSVSNDQGAASYTNPDRLMVKEKLDADFVADKTGGPSPLDVAFNDASKGSNIVSWLWEFGDGTSSTERNPRHKFGASSLYDVSLTVTTVEGSQDTEVKRGYINAFPLLMPGFRPPIFFTSPSAYVTRYMGDPGIPNKDTGISSDKYVCGIIGMQTTPGDVEERGRGDILQLYMYQQYSSVKRTNTWWIHADFRSYRDHENWLIDTLCLGRSAEGDTFLYRDNFRGLQGDQAHLTGIRTSEYFHCGVVGMQVLDGDIDSHGTKSVVWQAYMDGSGSEWKIVPGFATEGTNETWNVNVLCIKRGSHLAAEKPPFLTQTIYIPAGSNHKFGTGISESDYFCGIDGISAERGDINETESNVILITRMAVSGGTWWAHADFTSDSDDEDWRLEMLCLNKSFTSAGPPP